MHSTILHVSGPIRGAILKQGVESSSLSASASAPFLAPSSCSRLRPSAAPLACSPTPGAAPGAPCCASKRCNGAVSGSLLPITTPHGCRQQRSMSILKAGAERLRAGRHPTRMRLRRARVRATLRRLESEAKEPGRVMTVVRMIKSFSAPCRMGRGEGNGIGSSQSGLPSGVVWKGHSASFPGSAGYAM